MLVTPALMFFTCALAVCLAENSQEDKSAGERMYSNNNSLCYVCHIDLNAEQITTLHLAQGITCDSCHGRSSHHMNDEMLMTKPDILFGRTEVEPMCRLCHQTHKDPNAVAAFRREWAGRTRPNGRAVTEESICTDCHGTHNIIKKMANEADKDQASEWTPLFNEQNLDNWQVTGKAAWTVKRSAIVATTGPKGRGGDLWTNDMYSDYLLAVTFRAAWPIHAGIWLRDANGPRIEIFQSRKPEAFTGSVWIPGKGPALVNIRQDLFDPEAWNTISVKVQADRLQVWLNGEEIGAVRVKGPSKGRIGLHLQSGAAYKDAQLRVREVLLQRLGESPEKTNPLSKN
ncbi:MAG: 3-keto-disaccharide hydrolase [Planctomycetota bacterium]